jgi:hypothetical protein
MGKASTNSTRLLTADIDICSQGNQSEMCDVGYKVTRGETFLRLLWCFPEDVILSDFIFLHLIQIKQQNAPFLN